MIFITTSKNNLSKYYKAVLWVRTGSRFSWASGSKMDPLPKKRELKFISKNWILSLEGWGHGGV